MNWRHMDECMAAAKPIYGHAVNLIVWVKSAAAAGAFYRSRHELIGMFCVGPQPDYDMKRGRPVRRRSNVWHYGGANPFGSGGLDGLRSSPKPVALIADAIKDCTNRGDVVLDVSSGWGSTIVAAEHVGRRARALETEPRLVDFAIRRWQNVARSGARHVESGLSFEQIAADRTLSGHMVATTKRSRGRL
jgi:DNA modification methylase